MLSPHLLDNLQVQVQSSRFSSSLVFEDGNSCNKIINKPRKRKFSHLTWDDMSLAIERKLEEYRKLKAKEYAKQGKVVEMQTSASPSKPSDGTATEGDSVESANKGAFQSLRFFIDCLQNSRPVQLISNSSAAHPVILIILKIAVWLLLWVVFVKIEFGAVYFVISMMFIVYKNTRTGPKTGNKPSAYSVFNPNCERITGTFTAEQFDDQLRQGRMI